MKLFCPVKNSLLLAITYSPLCSRAAQSTARRRRAFSESGDDEQPEQQPESSPVRENSAELQSNGEGREGGGDKLNGDANLDDED